MYYFSLVIKLKANQLFHLVVLKSLMLDTHIWTWSSLWDSEFVIWDIWCTRPGHQLDWRTRPRMSTKKSCRLWPRHWGWSLQLNKEKDKSTTNIDVCKTPMHPFPNMSRVGLTVDLPFDLLLGQSFLELSVAQCVEDWHDLWPWPLTYWPEYQ